MLLLAVFIREHSPVSVPPFHTFAVAIVAADSNQFQLLLLYDFRSAGDPVQLIAAERVADEC